MKKAGAKKALVTDADRKSAREYMERAVPPERRIDDPLLWEQAVADVAQWTAELRTAAEGMKKRGSTDGRA
jgi:hypothetical protein